MSSEYHWDERQRVEPVEPVACQWIWIQDELAEFYRRATGHDIQRRATITDVHVLESMLDDVNSSFGIRISPDDLGEPRTIRSIAAEIVGCTRSAPPLLTIERGWGGVPILFNHGYFGVGFHCPRLSRAIGSEHPFFAIAPPRMEPRNITSIRRLSHSYLRLARRSMPLGPFVIGGYCLSGLMAVEMARQSLRYGNDVKLMVLLDTTCPDPGSAILCLLSRIIGTTLRWNMAATLGFFHYLYNRYPLMLHLLAPRPSPHVASGRNRLTEIIERLLRARAKAKSAIANLQPRSVTDHSDPLAPLRWAKALYRPETIGCRTVLYCSREFRESTGSDCLGWNRYCPGLDVVKAGDEHSSCITTHLDTIGNDMRERIRSI